MDFAKGQTVDILLNLGARFDVWSASAQGRLDVLTELLDQDPSSVNAPGGDGQRPLHVAASAEIAQLLIDRGADLEVRDTDHESTPIQYQINNLEIVKVLLNAGAQPDVFTAVVLNDVDLLKKILNTNPDMAGVHVGTPPFTTTQSNGGHIYAYVLGPTKSPLQVAAERRLDEVLEILQSAATPSQRLIVAAWSENEAFVKSILRDSPPMDFGADSRAITEAAQAGKTKTVELLLEAGLDPTTPGMDSGTALHVACWFGHIDVVKLLVDKVPLDLKDAHHGSPPLGWACHGSQWCRNPKGDYVNVVKTLIEAGADPSAPANSGGTTMLAQAGDREDVKQAIRDLM